MLRWPLTPIGLLAVLSLCACNKIIGMESPVVVEQKHDSSPPDAGTDVQVEGGDEADAGGGGSGGSMSPGCVLLVPPSPPAVADAGADSGDQKYVFALREVSFIGKEKGAPPGPGWDIDGTCTCHDAGPPSCQTPAGAGTYCDGPGGADYGSVAVFETASLAIPVNDVAKEINLGLLGMLLTLDGYDGTPNDPLVTATFLISPGLRGDGGVPTEPPKWDGTDSWPVTSSSYENPSTGKPRFVTSAAYVRDNILVARLMTCAVAFPWGNQSQQLNLTDVVLTGTVGQGDAGMVELRGGQIVARLRVDQLLETVGGVQLSIGGERVCENDIAWPVFHATVCKNADVMANSQGSILARCDAVSFLMTFNGIPALVGETVTLPSVDGGDCPDAQFNCDDNAGAQP